MRFVVRTSIAGIVTMFLLLSLPIGAGEGIGDRTVPEEIADEVASELPGAVENTGSFVENRGQWDSGLLFVGETSFGYIGIGRDCVYYDIVDRTRVLEDPGMMFEGREGSMTSDGRSEYVFRYTFQGAQAVEIRGEGALPHYTNYFLGNDQDRWATGVRSFERVVYEDLWNDVDMVFYFGEKGPKYDIVLGEGACIEDVRIRVEGQREIVVDRCNLDIKGPGAFSISDSGLKAYEKDGQDREVDVGYRMLTEDTFGFTLPEEASGRSIVIDPAIVSTYFGGANSDSAYSAGNDADGNIIFFGWTYSSDMPTTPGAHDRSLGGYGDIFVSMLDPTGSNLVFSTFIGGSGYDYYYYYGGMAMMDDGILVSCITSSSDYPTTAGCYDNSLTGSYDTAFSKLSFDGTSLLFSSYFGGGSYEYVYDVAPSADGGFYLLGSTYSSNLPLTSGAYQSSINGYDDCFIARFGSDGKTLKASTYLGGSSTDYPQRVREDGNGDIVVCGNAYSSNFPMKAGCYDTTHNGGTSDGFISIISGDGKTLIASTFLGGSGSEVPHGMAIDPDGNILLFGYTTSSGFPTTSGVIQQTYIGGGDSFITMMDGGLTSVMRSTFFGGSKDDSPVSIGFDAMGNVVVAGSTSSSNMPTTADAEDQTHNGGNDFFLSIVSSDLSEIGYSTYYGGSAHETGGELCIDTTGKIIVAGRTNSTNMPVNDDAYDKVKGGTGYYTDVFIFAIEHITVSEPLTVDSVKTYSDEYFTTEKAVFDLGERVYIEMIGTDSNASRRDGAIVNISSLLQNAELSSRVLVETDKDSGTFRGVITVPTDSEYLDTVRISSRKDPNKWADIRIDYPFRPSFVSTLTVHPAADSTEVIDKVDFGRSAFIKAMGFDMNPLMVDKAFVKITSDKNGTMDELFILFETGPSDGVFIGGYSITPSLEYFENITIVSLESTSVSTGFMVHTPLQIRTGNDISIAREDIPYISGFWNFGYSEEAWTISMNAPWLTWDGTEKRLYGTPTNREVGPWDILLNITDEAGNFDRLKFSIDVENAPPNITTVDVLTAYEGQEYLVDYDSDDDLVGEVKWDLLTNATFLRIDRDTGELYGDPFDEDVGTYYVIVHAEDDWDGVGSRTFNLTVENTNDDPVITTFDVRTVDQNEPYRRAYQVADPDAGDMHSWFLVTDADFLSIGTFTGVLEGLPDAYDVGLWNVNVTVKDLAGAKDSHEFQLEVFDLKDRPVLIDVPGDMVLVHGAEYIFDVNATDPDKGSTIEYSIRTVPDSDLSIDPVSGRIVWTASVIGLDGPDYGLEVTIKASDGELFTTLTFKLNVLRTEPPVSNLLSPSDGTKTSWAFSLLQWSGFDPEDDTLTYWVYLHESESYVLGRRDEALIAQDLSNDRYNLTGLTGLSPGKTYFWAVFPFDTCSFGTCANGPFELRVNNPPSLKALEDQRASAGDTFTIRITGSDLDTDDTLTFTLVQAPEGMEIGPTSGVITWRPKDDQVGDETVRVMVHDGIEGTETVFDIRVTASKGLDPILLMIGTIAAFETIVIAVLVFLLLRRSKGGPAEEKKEQEMESDKIMREIEELDKERQWEKEHATGPEPGKTIVSIPQEKAPPSPVVPTSPMEAHEHDKDKKELTYEDLYGLKMPERTESELEKEIQGSPLAEEGPVKQEKEESWDD